MAVIGWDTKFNIITTVISLLKWRFCGLHLIQFWEVIVN